MQPSDYYFWEYMDRFFIVEKSFWNKNHHINSNLGDVSSILPQGFEKTAEACFACYRNNKKVSKKETRKLLKEAGFEEIK